ncbi:MAG TPA: hypothetical protein DCL61_26580 [Cyanobacteria bacterium UBA12227]|nr:hypothetical protein [Cyanobacteria bacterium UBA12227]HAX89195.1 hypothetical protein [Cyanobacteria bacterium UBA11370]HBY78675.1 hypothetical protein [Cyanobacteria bacterium UBA11148]
MTRKVFHNIVSEIPLFQDLEQKEKFLFIIGALSARLISLKKAAEIMDLEPELLIKLLDIIGINFSYLSPEDVTIERN